MWKRMFTSKTTWAGVATIVAAVGGAVTGEYTTGVATQMVLGALVVIFFRDTVAKNEPK